VNVASDRPAESAPQASGLRMERDRFVALAFCWAEVLLELDSARKVVFAAGPTKAMIGLDAAALMGQAIEDLVAKEDRNLIGDLLQIASRHGRIENVTIRLQGPRGVTPPLAFAGYQLEDLDGHYFLALRTGVPTRREEAGGAQVRDRETGLHDSDSFADMVTRELAGAPPGEEERQMTLIALPGYEELRERMGDAAEHDLLMSVGAALRANSVTGDDAGRIDDDRYGLVHTADLDIAQLEHRIGDLIREADPTQEGLKVESATVEVDQENLSEEDIANGLIYTINRFKSLKGSDFTLKNLSTSISSLAKEAVESVQSFKATVAKAEFEVAFQPIIDTRTGVIHHYEALARFPASEGRSPYEQITFAEETGMIADFDLAMAKKVIEWLNKTPRNSNVSVAVNVSGYSVGTLSYLAQLEEMLNENVWTRGRLMFEITESARMDDLDAANTFIRRLRDNGHEVCLDDFGAGAANFQYLSTLEMDIVKLDGSAVRNAQKAHKGKAFLKALVGLCRELGVGTIAEMIDEEKGLVFVRECGVQYVQGYLFGKPNTDVSKFKTLISPHMFPNRPGV